MIDILVSGVMLWRDIVINNIYKSKYLIGVLFVVLEDEFMISIGVMVVEK